LRGKKKKGEEKKRRNPIDPFPCLLPILAKEKKGKNERYWLRKEEREKNLERLTT